MITTQLINRQLSTVSLRDGMAWLIAAIFVVGNLITPRLVHLIPDGGRMFLPIYFFTLIGGYRYGWKVGFLVALLSPVVNHLLFGMPTVSMATLIMAKGVILSACAALAAKLSGKVSLIAITAAVIGSMALGTLAEWGIVGNFASAADSVVLGVPGFILQIAGGYLVLKCITKSKPAEKSNF